MQANDGPWCNGSTAGFGPAGPGSTPGGPVGFSPFGALPEFPGATFSPESLVADDLGEWGPAERDALVLGGDTYRDWIDQPNRVLPMIGNFATTQEGNDMTEQDSQHDFGQGPVPAHRHTNPDDSLGGWVADTAHVSQDCFVGPNAEVADEAIVQGHAHVLDYARVCGKAIVGNHALVRHAACVGECALVTSHAAVEGIARIHGSAVIEGISVVVAGRATVMDEAYVGGSAVVAGNVLVRGAARVFGNAVVYTPGTDDRFHQVMIHQKARVGGHAIVGGPDPGHMCQCEVYGLSRVLGNARIRDSARIANDGVLGLDPDQERNVMRGDDTFFQATGISRGSQESIPDDHPRPGDDYTHHRRFATRVVAMCNENALASLREKYPGIQL